MTERLYEQDWRHLDFDATVVEVRREQDRVAVVLDRTAFYPTGGGQPHDTGFLDEHEVREVIAEEKDGTVLHWLAGGTAPDPGAGIHGRVDQARRRDHMQQHTGQHILSQAFVQVAGRQTASFHLGEQLSTIDVEGPVDDAILERAEALANEVVFDDRPLTVHQVTPAELDRFDIRRQTFHGERIRLIEIPDFDVSTCGGTHARRTGEVGLVVITGVERVRDLARVSFACGTRALQEYRQAAGAADAAGRALSTSRDHVGPQVEALVQRSRAQQKRLKQLAGVAAAVEAESLLEGRETGTTHRVVQLFGDRSFDEVQALARALVAEPGVVALLASAPDGKLVFARSGDVDVAMGALMKETVAQFGGRGGGSPAQAQGAVAAGKLQEALQHARERTTGSSQGDR